MVLAQNNFILNFLISNSNIKRNCDLPNLKLLFIKIFYKKKTIYLVMTTFFIFFFLSSKRPKLLNLNNLRSLILKLNRNDSFYFLYNFYWLFFKYNNLHFSYLNLKKYQKHNVRIFFYTLQNIFFELFFFKMIQCGNWENLIFKLELLIKFTSLHLKVSSLIFYFKGLKLIS